MLLQYGRLFFWVIADAGATKMTRRKTTKTTALASTTGTMALEGTSMTGITIPLASTTETTFATSTTLSAANALGHGSGAVDPGYVAAALPTVCRGIANVGATKGNLIPFASDSCLLPCSISTGTTRKTIVLGRRRGIQGNRMSSAHRKVEKKEGKKRGEGDGCQPKQ